MRLHIADSKDINEIKCRCNYEHSEDALPIKVLDLLPLLATKCAIVASSRAVDEHRCVTHAWVVLCPLLCSKC